MRLQKIFVSSVSRVPDLLKSHRPDAILSIGAQPTVDEALRPRKQIFLDFADIDRPTARNEILAAKASDIDAIRSLVEYPTVLINCNRGQRRSTAAALVLLHEALDRSRPPRHLADWIWSLADYVDFNQWILHLAGIDCSQLGPSRPFVQAPRSAHFELDLAKIPEMGS